MTELLDRNTSSEGLLKTQTHPIIIGSIEFWERFLEAAKVSKTRLRGKVMSHLEDGPFSASITDLFIDRSKKGIESIFCRDGSSDSCPDGHVSITPPRLRKLSEEALEQSKRTKLKIQAMAEAGVDVREVNPLNVLRREFPILCSDHTKVFIADSAAWVTSINLTQAHMTNPGIAYETHNPYMVSALDYLFFNREGNPEGDCMKKDQEWYFHPDTTLITSCGAFKKAPIIDQAVETVKKGADRFTLISQLLPDGRLLESLIQAARKGTEVVFITSSSSTDKYSAYPYKLFYGNIKDRVAGLHKLHIVHYPGFMLAKMFLAEGQSASLSTGSDNFSQWSALFCTREANVVTTNETAVKEAHEFAENLLSQG